MKKYNVTVNGETYTVEVEEVGAVSAPAVAPAPVQAAAPVANSAPVAAPAPVAPAAAAPQEKPKAAVNAPGFDVLSPLPGTVLRISAKIGQEVKAGDLLLVLEAMKMENDIVAPEDGVVKAIAVNAGETVQANDLLVVI